MRMHLSLKSRYEVVWERNYAYCPLPTGLLTCIQLLHSPAQSHNANGNVLECSLLVSHAYNVLDWILDPLTRVLWFHPLTSHNVRTVPNRARTEPRTTPHRTFNELAPNSWRTLQHTCNAPQQYFKCGTLTLFVTATVPGNGFIHPTNC